MNKQLAKIDPALLALMHGAFGKDGALQPFAREIMLTECHIAGTNHEELKNVEPSLSPGALLILRREPNNAHDKYAIQIHDEAGHRIGYVPRVKNEPLARLMDAGKFLFGTLESKIWVSDWLKAEARIYLRDY